ncbi:MAG TPA: hypothetical protein VNA20_12770 [Frankiaceae bacterium]|nr:hypothetical protein [Frankiaceae bacterium]
MSEVGDTSEAGEPRGSTGTTGEPEAQGRRWWQRLPVVLLVGAVPVPFGLFFMAFIAMAMLLRDSTRDVDARAGGAVALFWWAYSFRQGETSPYISLPMLVLAAVLFARSALARRRGTAAGPAWAPALGVLGAAAFAVVAFVPYGYRAADVARDDAVRRVLAERSARPWRGIDATSYLADSGRTRLVHAPQWYVALYERSTTEDRTRDNQPCFSRREVWRVDAVTGDVARSTYDEAVAYGDPCLPIRAGTERDLKPVAALAP